MLMPAAVFVAAVCSTAPAHPLHIRPLVVLKHTFTFNYSTNPPHFVKPNVRYRVHNSPSHVSGQSFSFVQEFSSVGTANRYGLDRVPARARFSAPVQTGPGAYPMDTGSLPRG